MEKEESLRLSQGLSILAPRGELRLSGSCWDGAVVTLSTLPRVRTGGRCTGQEGPPAAALGLGRAVFLSLPIAVALDSWLRNLLEPKLPSN